MDHVGRRAGKLKEGLELIGGAEGDRTPGFRIANGKTGSLQFLTCRYIQ